MFRQRPFIDTTVDAARLVACATLFLLVGCRHTPLAYTLKQEGRTQLLTPPVSKPEVKSARRHPAQKKGCDIQEESFSVAWHGNSARVSVKTETYYAPPPASGPAGPPGVTIAESGPRIYADTLADLEHFRETLAARESTGCFSNDEDARLRQSIVEKFPLPPQIASFLRFGTYARTGFFDLLPDFVLRVVSPTGADPDLSFYDVTSVPGGGRTRIALVSGAGKGLAVPETPAYFRYLYWTGGASHNFRTTILGVPLRAMLDDATDRFLSDPEAYCAKPAEGVWCRSIAASVGMNAGFYVRINDQQVFVRLGGSLGEALSEGPNGMRLLRGAPPVPQNVTVRRMFHGKLIPIRVDGAPRNILALVAMPGDEITAK